jgi:hypothetical protein
MGMTKPLLCREKRFLVLVHGQDAARTLAVELAAHLYAGEHKGRHIVSPLMADASPLERHAHRRLGIKLYRALGPARVLLAQEVVTNG